MSRLAHESGAPGRVFKLTESELIDALRACIDEEDALGLVTPTGAVQLTWSADPALVATRILDGYYKPAEPRAPEICAGPEGDKPVEDNRLEHRDQQGGSPGNAHAKIPAGVG